MLKLTSRDLTRTPVEALVIPVCQDRDIHTDPVIAALIEKAAGQSGFKGAPESEMVYYQAPEIRARRIVLLGLGTFDKLDAEVLRRFAGKAVKKCIGWDLSETMIAVPAPSKLKLKAETVLSAVQEGAYLGNHQFERYKKSKHACLKRILFYMDKKAAGKLRRLSRRLESICRATVLAREWVNTAPNDKRPHQLAASIVETSEKAGLSAEVMNKKQLKRKKFGATLAVAAGSDSKPQLIVLKHRPEGAKKNIALVGKGVTFDAGGINLKPTGSIELMKMDMAGAAAVAGAMIGIAGLGLDLKVTAIIPIVENMVSGSATRPGDIVTAYNGKTVEIGNTDAEGRLILIDALSWAIETLKPDAIIDLATLTGACVVALGEKIAGVFSPDDKLTGAIVEAGRRTDERCWPMPLPDDYKEQLKSDFADFINVGPTRYGGALTAALFLKEFVGNTRWAHIDIAGPAYSKKETAYCPAGGTGFGVRLLCELMRRL